jgi:hypothetical protein
VKGTVRRRENGDWEYRFEAGKDPLTGTRRRFGKSGFKTRREAEQALRKAITAHEQGRTVRASTRTVALSSPKIDAGDAGGAGKAFSARNGRPARGTLARAR